ncbi:polyprenyl synthetase family protein [Pseudobacteriovorax antillogorgiicola]|uniref:Geranylgeranyl pyrophosphate synthase n=1 Tax=Pseudobacteriovorax antillogorgiicola TaxID=1513793 RepID=A0A1Y6BPR9_9BACT|nr:polyprenyl synthetase family protein [Pseudobacteriovorax antillogorgiicola]TCS55477.1 geranylgeranyl pyrophosphate synthase [Pseudobacteriovorax antillogorgiicola]SMF11973.1 Geranylgeranyl pyrophosphate synthase [Pseudobacteriovorax antillogorgiicola]
MTTDLKDRMSEKQFLNMVLDDMDQIVDELASGKLHPMVKRCFAVQGKLTRPKAVFHLANVLACDLKQARAWAVTCELLHCASLVHDDLQDGDLYRRGQPTMWSVYGENMAINLGDFLLLCAPQALLEAPLPSDVKTRLHKEFIKMSTRMVGGQCEEFVLNELGSCEDLYRSYLSCIGGKTATFFAKLARGVATLSSANVDFLNQLETLFFDIGLLFQLQDDILDLYGDKQRREVGCDIREGKISILIVYQLMLFPDRLKDTKQLLHTDRDQVSEEQVLAVRDQFISDGTLDAAIEDVQERMVHIAAHPLLEGYPGLRKLVTRLITDIVRPIEHLLTPCQDQVQQVTSSY